MNIYDYEWLVYNNHKLRILNKWIQKWFLYQLSRQTGFTNNLKSIILPALEDYRHQYLGLWMSGVFNNDKFTILNEWSQQWSHHPDYLPSGVNKNLKVYNFDWLRLLFTSKSSIMREWCLQWAQVYNDEWVQSKMIPSSRLSTEKSQ